MAWGPLLAIAVAAACLRLWALDYPHFHLDEWNWRITPASLSDPGTWLNTLDQHPGRSSRLSLNAPPSSWLNTLDQHGQMPLYMLAFLALDAVGVEPVLSQRLVSAAAGVAITIGLYLLGTCLFDRRIGLSAAAVHAVSPLGVLVERFGSADALLAALGLGGLYASMRLAQTARLRWALVSGAFLAVAAVTKINALFLFPGPILAAFLLWERDRLRAVGGAVLSILLGGAPLLVLLLLAPQAETVIEKPDQFNMSVRDVLALPFAQWQHNFNELAARGERYLGWVGMGVLLFAVGLSAATRSRAGLWLAAVWFVPVLYLLFFNRDFWAKWLTVSLPYGELLLAWGIWRAGRAAGRLVRPGLRLTERRVGQAVSAALLVLVLGSTAPGAITLAASPANAPYEKFDHAWYVLTPYTGYGVREAYAFLAREMAVRPGYYVDNQKWPQAAVGFSLARAMGAPQIEGRRANIEELAPEVLGWSVDGRPLYFLANETEGYGTSDGETAKLHRLLESGRVPARALGRFPRANGRSWVSVYRIDPDDLRCGPLLAGARLSVADGDSESPTVAPTDDGFVIVWSDRRGQGEQPQLYAAGVSRYGQKLESGEAALVGPGRAEAPSALWMFGRGLLAWEDDRNGQTEIYASALDKQAGAGPSSRVSWGVAYAGQPSHNPTLVSTLSGAMALFDQRVGGENFEVFMAPLSTGGNLAGAETQLTRSPGVSRRPSAAFAPPGAGHAPPLRPPGDETVQTVRPSAAFAPPGAGHAPPLLVAWQEDETVQAALLREQDELGTAMSLGAGASPQVVWSGQHFVVVWGSPEGTVHLARFDSEGRLADRREVARASRSWQNLSPAVASSGVGLAVVWNGPEGIWLQHLTSAGEPAAAPLLVRALAAWDRPRWPDIASNGDSYLIAWSDEGWGWTEITYDMVLASPPDAATCPRLSPGQEGGAER